MGLGHTSYSFGTLDERDILSQLPSSVEVASGNVPRSRSTPAGHSWDLKVISSSLGAKVAVSGVAARSLVDCRRACSEISLGEVYG